MNINDFIIETNKYSIRPRIVCTDGFVISVQASGSHYCAPRIDGCDSYHSFEIGFPSIEEPVLFKYAESEDHDVFAYVPKQLVEMLLQKHGGIEKLSGGR